MNQNGIVLNSVLAEASQRTWNFALRTILGFAIWCVLLSGETWFQLSMRIAVYKNGTEKSVSGHWVLLPLHL